MEMWAIEEIPDPDSLFYRVSIRWLRKDLKVAPGLFSENKGSISSDWEKYSSPTDTRARQGRPEQYAVIRMVAGRVREIKELTIKHSPVHNVPGQVDNRAHTDIFGLLSREGDRPDLGRKLRIRLALYERFSTWEIAPNAPVDLRDQGSNSQSPSGPDPGSSLPN